MARTLGNMLIELEQLFSQSNGPSHQLEQLLLQRLQECGYFDQLKQFCDDRISDEGVDFVDLQQVQSELVPNARQLLPESAMKEILQLVRNHLQQALERERLLP